MTALNNNKADKRIYEIFYNHQQGIGRAADCVIVGVYNRGKLGVGAADIDAASKGIIRDLIKSGDISTELGRCTVLTQVSGVKAKRVAVAGLGKSGSLDAIGFEKRLARAPGRSVTPRPSRFSTR